jgi:hypothetical protein
MLSTLTGRRVPQGAQEGIHGVDSVDQAIRDADEGGVAQVRLAAERRLERAERGNWFGRLAGPERERQAAHRRLECRGECVQPLRSDVTGVAMASSEPCAANLFGAVTNGWPISSAIFVAISLLKFGGAFKPVPTAVPPAASSNRPASDARTRASASGSCCA